MLSQIIKPEIMKKTVLKYGLISGGIMIGIFTVLMAMSEMTDPLDFDTQEILGYSSMIIATSVVYFGIKHYRDNENNGNITFGKGLAIGLLIVMFPAVLIGAGDVFYTTIINPEWMETYYATYASEMQATMSEEEFKTALAQMESEKEMFANPMFTFFIMFSTVFLIGLIVAIISSLVLKKG